MRQYSNLEIDSAAEWFDWGALLDEQGIPFHPRGEELVASCPFCHHDGRPSFFLNSGTGMYFCHVCGAKGGPVQAASALMGLSYQDAIKRLMYGNIRPLDLIGDDEEEEVTLVDTTPLIELPGEYLPLAGDTSRAAARYRAYLTEERGLSEEIIASYEIGFCAHGYLTGYVIVPVYHLGQLVTFIARAINRMTTPKVWTPPGNEEGDYLFNLDHIWGTKSVVITEGVFDALVLPDCAVATFGKKISDRQLHLLKASGATELILCWDEDADVEIANTASRIGNQFVTKVVNLPRGKDPSDLGPEQTRTFVLAAQPEDRSLISGSTPIASIYGL